MRFRRLFVALLLLFIWVENGNAKGCRELKSRMESIAVTRFLDSSALSRELSVRFPGVGNRLSLDDGKFEKKIPESPFEGLFVIQSKASKYDSLLYCQLGEESPKFAHLVRGGIFVKVTLKDIINAKGNQATWKDLIVFLDLGIKLPTPKSIQDLKSRIEKDSIRMDSVFSQQQKVKPDPWFGVFYKETKLKSYIYGIKYAIRNDTLRLDYYEPYFRFSRTAYPNEDWLDGASGVYIPDTPEYHNEERLDKFIEKNHE